MDIKKGDIFINNNGEIIEFIEKKILDINSPYCQYVKLLDDNDMGNNGLSGIITPNETEDYFAVTKQYLICSCKKINGYKTKLWKIINNHHKDS